MAKRFAESTEEEISEKRRKLNAGTTLKSNKSAAKILKDYLVQKGQDENFENLDDVSLDEVLGHFYLDLRKSDGTYYKANSLESIRHGINRYSKVPPSIESVISSKIRLSPTAIRVSRQLWQN